MSTEESSNPQKRLEECLPLAWYILGGIASRAGDVPLSTFSHLMQLFGISTETTGIKKIIADYVEQSSQSLRLSELVEDLVPATIDARDSLTSAGSLWEPDLNNIASVLDDTAYAAIGMTDRVKSFLTRERADWEGRFEAVLTANEARARLKEQQSALSAVEDQLHSLERGVTNTHGDGASLPEVQQQLHHIRTAVDHARREYETAVRQRDSLPDYSEDYLADRVLDIDEMAKYVAADGSFVADAVETLTLALQKATAALQRVLVSGIGDGVNHNNTATECAELRAALREEERRAERAEALNRSLRYQVEELRKDLRSAVPPSHEHLNHSPNAPYAGKNESFAHAPREVIRDPVRGGHIDTAVVASRKREDNQVRSAQRAPLAAGGSQLRSSPPQRTDRCSSPTARSPPSKMTITRGNGIDGRHTPPTNENISPRSSASRGGSPLRHRNGLDASPVSPRKPEKVQSPQSPLRSRSQLGPSAANGVNGYRRSGGSEFSSGHAVGGGSGYVAGATDDGYGEFG
eukprot:Rmarinus@m.21649